MYCPECGIPNADNASFCSACGAQLPAEPRKEVTSNPIVTPTDDATRVIVPPVAPPPPPLPAAPQRKSGNAMLFIIIAILAVALIGLAVMFFLKSGSSSRSNGLDEPEELVEEFTKPEPISGDFPGDVSNSDTRFQSFDWLSERTITLSDLAGLSAGDLRILRNAIFAMHDYSFKSSDLQEYFGRFSWYDPLYTDVTPMLSATEKANIAMIQKHEGKGTSGSTASTAGGKSKLKNVTFANDYSDVVCYVYLEPVDLLGMNSEQLRILRNTIYARHGRRFKDASLQRYFNGMPWYTPTCNEVYPSALSAVEKHNIEVIQSVE